jgi:eukaryotic-like serine/threonine-protein kinase
MSREPAHRVEPTRIDRAILEYLEAVDSGAPLDLHEFLRRHADLNPELERCLTDLVHADRLTAPIRNDADLPQSHEMESLPGTIGGYRLLRFLGAGGMGRVFEAEDSANRRVALKLIVVKSAASSHAIERFRREGRLAAMINDPRCVFVIEANEDAGRPYIVMELMPGETLKDLVDRGGPLAPIEAVTKILDVIEGLRQAHELGVIHRDVKPSNCYLDSGGRVKVGDFGLARSLAWDSALTHTGGFVGTPHFAAPEQIKGEKLDARADVYSVAATLYFLLTGRAPFGDSDGAAAVARAASEDPPSPRRLRPQIPRALERVLLKGLERNRARRFGSLDDLRNALVAFVPRELTIAGMGLRLASIWVDVLPFALVMLVANLEASRRGAVPNPWVLAAVSIVLSLYLWMSEGLLGATIGRMLFGLRVVRAGPGFQPPGLPRAFVRTFAYMATSGLVADIVYYSIRSPAERSRWAFFGIVVYAMSLAARFSTMRGSNGYRGLHEIMSGTRVLRAPTAAPKLALPRSAEQGAPFSLIRADALPQELGGFRIVGAVRWDDDERILVGEDAALGRLAWIRPRRDHAELVPFVRRSLSRHTRLRWLGSGEHGPTTWDAFVAPSGRPLDDWTSSRALGWTITRAFLEQLTHELITAQAEETLPKSLTLSQVWARPSGQLQLIDFPTSDVRSTDQSDGESSIDAHALRLLAEVAERGLRGGTSFSNRQAQALPGVVPRHAREMLDRLAGRGRPYSGLDEWRADLDAIRHRPTEITLSQRAGQVVAASLFSLTVLFFLAIWVRIPGVAAAVATDRALVQMRILMHVLEHDDLRESLCQELPPTAVACRDTASAISLLKRRSSRDRADLAARLRALGPLGSMTAMKDVLREGNELAVERARDPVFTMSVRIATWPVSYEISLRPWEVAWLLDRARRDAPLEFSRIRPFTLVVCSMPLALFVVLAFVTRGGLGSRLAGLALVRADGRDASRTRAAWRTTLVMIPFFFCITLIIWIDTGTTARLWLWPLPYALASAVAVADIALALVMKTRTPYDWMAGTYVVPR